MKPRDTRMPNNGWIEATVTRPALALLLAIAAGCAAVTPARDPAARLPEMQQVLREARSTAAGIQDEKFKGLVLSVITMWQVKAGDVRGALETAATIERASDKASALREIAAAQAKAGDRAGALANLQRALETAATIEDVSSKAPILRGIAAAQANVGDRSGAGHTFQQARQAAITIEDASYKAQALYKIAAAQAKAGHVRSARLTRLQALQAAAAIEDASKKAAALREIAAAQAGTGDFKEAGQTFDRALEAATAIPITKDRFMMGDLEKPIAVALIAADRTKAGDVQGALAWAAALSEDPVAKASVLVGVAAGVLQPMRRLGEKYMSAEKRLLPRWANF